MSSRLDRLETQIGRIDAVARRLEFAVARLDPDDLEKLEERVSTLETGWRRAIVVSLTTMVTGLLALAAAITTAAIKIKGG